MHLRKYFQIFKLTLQEYLVYRLNFLLWRFRNYISFLALIIFWQVAYQSKNILFGYSENQMMTYIFGVVILRNIIFSSRSADMAGQIRSGELGRLLIRPLGVFSYWLSRDMADKVLNVVFTIIEVSLLLWLFKINLYFPQEATSYIYFFVAVTLAFFLNFILSMTISITAFWTEDVWATRWLFGIIFLEFLAGSYFPLDVLPKWLMKFIVLTPFPYLLYYPVKIWNEQLIGFQSWGIILVCVFWLVFFYLISIKLWRRGVKNFNAYGD